MSLHSSSYVKYKPNGRYAPVQTVTVLEDHQLVLMYSCNNGRVGSQCCGLTKYTSTITIVAHTHASTHL